MIDLGFGDVGCCGLVGFGFWVCLFGCLMFCGVAWVSFCVLVVARCCCG